MEENKQPSTTAVKINKAVAFLKRIGNVKNKINKRMEGKYSPTIIALCATFVSVILMIIMLFIPNYLGVADDGSLSPTMNSAGIYYVENSVSDIYNNYFIKSYSNVLSGYSQAGSTNSSQIIIIKAAKAIDDLFTKDTMFDIRFLALLYVILYTPAMFLLIKQASERVRHFSEGIVIGFFGVLIFADVAYITYFNSFYPEAIWLISLMYIVGAATAFQNNNNKFIDFGFLILFIAAGMLLMSSKRQCAVIGIILAIYCIKLIFIRKHWMWAIICTLSALLLTVMSVTFMIKLTSDFDDTSKFHAMTRGVLFESDNPETTLVELGIEPSYEMLTDASTYDYLPLVKSTDPVLKDFLNSYTVADISAYYVRHPGKLMSMLDVSIKSCFSIRRTYCGNYEKNVGLPEKARSLFWSAWSTFKTTNAPQTIGFLIILMGAIIMLYSKNYSIRPRGDNRRNTVFIDTMMILLLIILSQAVITIVNSGDAEMVKHCFIVSLGMDIMTYFAFAQIVHKLNIF